MSNENHYIYALINPKDSSPYYIGKGQNRQNKQSRTDEHFQPKKLKTCGNRHKVNKIKKLKREGYTPKNHCQKIKSGLSKEKAYELEKFLISEIGLENLTNIHDGGNGGRNERAIEKATGENSKVSKLKKQQASEIKWLVNKSKMNLKEVASHYNISLSVVSHIRIGRTWKHVDEEKPEWYEGDKQKRLSPEEKKAQRKKRASEAKWLANNTKMSYNDIAEQYEVHENTIKKDMWERADKLKASKPTWYDGPIVDLEEKKEQKRKRIAEIKWLCENTDLYHYEIAEKYDVKKHRPSDLHSERVKKHISPKKPDWYNENEETKKQRRMRKVGEIKWLGRNSKMEYSRIADIYDVHEVTVLNISNNNTWKTVSPQKPDGFPPNLELN